MARRPPKRMTASRLHNVAFHYLERYQSSRANLRRLLMRRVHKAATHFDEDPAQGADWVEAELDALEAQNLLNDNRYANMKALALHRRGASARMIEAKLRVKGVPSAAIEGALEAIRARDGDIDLKAACTFARKRRLGPWSRGARSEDWSDKQKDMAKFARGGFSFSVAKEILDSTDADALEQRAFGDRLF